MCGLFNSGLEKVPHRKSNANWLENRQEKNLTTQDAKREKERRRDRKAADKKNTLNQNDEFIITVNFTECDTIAFQTAWNSQIAYGSFLFIKNNLAPHFR